MSQFPKTTFRDVPFPVELHLPGIRVVSLAASGTSVHVLDADGNVHVWGKAAFDSFHFMLDVDNALQ